MVVYLLFSRAVGITDEQKKDCRLDERYVSPFEKARSQGTNSKVGYPDICSGRGLLVC